MLRIITNTYQPLVHTVDTGLTTFTPSLDLIRLIEGQIMIKCHGPVCEQLYPQSKTYSSGLIDVLTECRGLDLQ